MRILLLLPMAAALCASAGEIHDAVRSRDAARLEQMLKAQPGAVNDVLPQGITALHMAAAEDSAEMVQLLVANGAKIDARTDSGATPLHWAVLMNAGKAAKALVDAGANTLAEAMGGLSPLALARQKDSQAVVAVLEAAEVKPAPEKAVPPPATGSFADGCAAFKAGRMNEAYEIFLVLLKQNPANENVNFALGLAAFSLKKFSHASMAYERVLAANPRNDRAKLELGRTYFAIGEFDLARQTLEDVLSREQPAKVRQSIDQMMQAMGRGGLRRPWVFKVELGALYDDNANVGPDADIIQISPIVSGNLTINTIPVGEESRPIRTLGATLSAAASGGFELGKPGGWSVACGGGAFADMLESRADDLEMVAGGMWGGLRRDRRESVLHTLMKVQHIERGGEGLVDIYGAASSLSWFFGSRSSWQSLVSAEAEYRNYSDLNDRDGPCYTLRSFLGRHFSKTSAQVFGGASLFFEDAKEAVYENAGGQVEATYEQRLPWGMSAFGRAGFLRSLYAKKETLAPEKRRDYQYQFAAGLEKRIGAQWCVNAGWHRTENNSTFDLYEYKRDMFSCSLAYRY